MRALPQSHLFQCRNGQQTVCVMHAQKETHTPHGMCTRERECVRACVRACVVLLSPPQLLSSPPLSPLSSLSSLSGSTRRGRIPQSAHRRQLFSRNLLRVTWTMFDYQLAAQSHRETEAHSTANGLPAAKAAPESPLADLPFCDDTEFVTLGGLVVGPKPFGTKGL